jgi:hypothetical protein
MRYALIISAALIVVACGDKKKDDLQGLPPADDWHAQGMAGTAPGADPHGGMANPHAGMGAGDPHAGMDMNDPHAGMNMGGSSVEELGLPPPDPNKPIDPDKYLRGIITVADEVKDRVKAGSTLFLMVRKAGADGPGALIAVDVKTISKLPAAFELDGGNAMVGGTEFDGQVVVGARLDQDGDAGTKQPGDVEGEVKATIPADSLVLTLDTVRQ